jgi:hypothetical protein
MKSRWVHRRKVTFAELIDEPWCVAPSLMAADAFLASGLKMPCIAVTTKWAEKERQAYRCRPKGTDVRDMGPPDLPECRAGRDDGL